jgi:hypothetical protein
MNKDEYKKEYIDRIKNGQLKNFEIEKVSISDDDPIIQKTKRWVGDQPVKPMTEKEIESVVNHCKEMLRPRTEEELKQLRKELKYPGLPYHMRRKYKPVPQRTFCGIQIRIGWWK